MVASQTRDGVAPVVVAERARRLGDLPLGLAEEFLAVGAQARRVVVEQLLLSQQRLERIASDCERAVRLREEIRAQPGDVAVECVGRGARGGQERTTDDPPERRVGQRLRQLVAQERGVAQEPGR